MSWHDFIFSNQSKHRIRRHLACWLLWWVYIIFILFFTPPPPIRRVTIQPFYRNQPGLKELGLFSYSSLILLKSFLLVSFHVLFCYATVYILLPAFLTKRRYWILIPGLLLIGSLMVPVGYFLYSIAYPFIDKLFELHLTQPDKHILWRGIDAGLINAIKVTLIAVAIALLKRWWINQKEKEQLEKERLNAEVQLLKAQIHPAFLFSTLNNITSEARLASSIAPQMLIKLSDILSYMLYECDAPKVKLEKEIGMIREYMTLEKMRQGDRLEMTFKINGDINEQLISPLLLLPFIDYSFSYCNNELVEQAWVNLTITVGDNNLSMKLINGIPAGIERLINIDEEALANIEKRLLLLYPDKHQLKINAEQELIMVHLNLKLEEATSNGQPAVTTAKTVLSYAGV